MAFQEISDLSADTTISLGGFNKKTRKENPTQVEGYYLGSRTIPDNKKKSGISYIYFFQTAKGNVGVWGKTDMDRKMSGVPVGTMTKVAFDRMVPTANGEMYKYKVAVDTDNTISVAAPAPTATVSSFSSASDEDVTDDQEEDDNGAALSALLKSKKRA